MNLPNSPKTPNQPDHGQEQDKSKHGRDPNQDQGKSQDRQSNDKDAPKPKRP